MKISIQINQGPYQYQASDTAYQFTKAAIDNGHHIFRVFFYHDGVNNASHFAMPPQDERNITNKWATLKQKDGSNIDLIVCVASAFRRGILDNTKAKANNIKEGNIHPAFQISGLGQLVEAIIHSDRLVIFGG